MNALIEALNNFIANMEDEADSLKKEDAFTSAALHRRARELRVIVEGGGKETITPQDVGNFPEDFGLRDEGI